MGNRRGREEEEEVGKMGERCHVGRGGKKCRRRKGKFTGRIRKVSKGLEDKRQTEEEEKCVWRLIWRRNKRGTGTRVSLEKF